MFWKKRLVFLHPYFQGGGVEKSILRLSEVALAHGYACSILTIRPDPAAYADDLARLGLTPIDLGAAQIRGALKPAARFVESCVKAGDQVFLIANQSYVNVAAVALRLLTREKFRLILSERLHYDEIRLNCGRARGWLIPKLMWATYRFADTVLANSAALAADISALTGVACQTSYNPTLDSSILAQARAPLTHRWLGRKEFATILAAGRLEKVKGFDILLRALAMARAELPQARLVLLGDGALRGELQALARSLDLADCVEFAGFQKNPYPWMRAADLYVLSSFNEGLPNTLIEALICGTPAVATDCRCGPRDILLDGLGGDLVNVGDPAGLAEAMLRNLRDPQYAQQRLASAREGLSRFEQQTAGCEFLRLVDPGFDPEQKQRQS